MLSTTRQSSTVKLSICIATFNRATFIGATLENILGETTDDCEVMVLDGGSTDDTERVVTEYAQRSNRLRYIRQDVNSGIDQDYDRAVELATGEYCWLMADDDLLKPGAVETVLKALSRNVSLVIVNAEQKNFSMSKVLQPSWIAFESDRYYQPNEMDRLFTDAGNLLQYIGCVVIRRSIWLMRDRQRYYGTWFVFVGVIFQKPLPGEALLISKPLISYRRGNAHVWSPKVLEIVWGKWPLLVSSLALSKSTKENIENVEPWRNLQELVMWRGLGVYSMTEYKRWIRPQPRLRNRLSPFLIALLPGALVNSLLILYYFITRRSCLGFSANVLLQELKASRFHLWNWGVARPAA